MVKNFYKKSGLAVDFDVTKIKKAIKKIVPNITDNSVDILLDEVVNKLDNVDDIVDGKIVDNIVDTVLINHGYTNEVNITKEYRQNKQNTVKAIKVKLHNKDNKLNITDSILLIKNEQYDTAAWDRQKIINQLKNLDVKISKTDINDIAKNVEKAVLQLNTNLVTTALIRELVNNELVAKGYNNNLIDTDNYSVSKQFINSLIFNRNNENSNVASNNPEAINLGISEYVLKRWALDNIFSPEVKRAHNTSMIHLHDLGMPTRVYCSAHSIEYLKKYGLKGLLNLNSESKPANSASVLTGHLNTYLASMQANYAGALGLGYINIFYAPLLSGMSDNELYQVAQELVFNGSQNAFARGSQSLFIDYNIHAGIPSYLKSVPAVGKGGRYMYKLNNEIIYLKEITLEKDGQQLMSLYTPDGKLVLEEDYTEQKGLYYKLKDENIVTYADYTDIATRFAMALLHVFYDGDANGKPFFFPKCDFHVSKEVFNNPAQYEVFKYATEVASHNGSTYFVFDRDEVTLSACCRLKTVISSAKMLMHPECLRFCGFQNVSINIPQAAYRAARNDKKTPDGLWEEVEHAMDIAMEAHMQKKAAISEMLQPSGPLYQIGKIANDGVPYVDLENCTYIIGIIGVNDAIHYITGKNLHESEEASDIAMQLIAKMFLKVKEYSEKYGIHVTLEETPAESAAGKLAKSDLQFFPESIQVIRGTTENPYYTNSIHIIPEADVDIVERIRKQSVYHNMIESGAIIHVFLGAERPEKEAIEELVRKTFDNTQCAQLVFSPEYTVCDDCHHMMNGLVERCDTCGSHNITQFSRIVGYYSVIKKSTSTTTQYGWNASKISELADRDAGNYTMEK